MADPNAGGHRVALIRGRPSDVGLPLFWDCDLPVIVKMRPAKGQRRLPIAPPYVAVLPDSDGRSMT